MNIRSLVKSIQHIALLVVISTAFQGAQAAKPHSGIVAIYGGPLSNSTCVKLADQRIQCWGDMFTGLGQLDYFPTSVYFADISMGEGFFCALRTNGYVQCTGNNSLGQLGNGSTTTPTGLDFTFVLNSSGDLLTDVVQISAGDAHVCALKSDHTVWCWGSNGSGQVGNFNITAGIQSSAVQVVINDAAHDVLGSVDWISAGGNHTCIEFLQDPRGAVTGACWGDNAHGQLGSGAITTAERSPVTIEVSGASGLEPLQMSSRTLKSGFQHTCAMISDTAACWGDDNRGATSTGLGGNTPLPATVIISDGTTVTNIKDLSLGYDFSCLVFTDTTGACWGANDQGQLGNYLLDRADSDSPVGVVRVGGTEFSGFSSLVSGYAHTCVLMQNAKVYCWGDNRHHQLGLYPYSYSDVAIETGDGTIFTDDLEGG